MVVLVLVFSLSSVSAVSLEGDWRDISWNVIFNASGGDTIVLTLQMI